MPKNPQIVLTKEKKEILIKYQHETNKVIGKRLEVLPTLHEELQQMLSKEINLTGKYEWEEDEWEATERITAITTVMKMIEERQPVVTI